MALGGKAVEQAFPLFGNVIMKGHLGCIGSLLEVVEVLRDVVWALDDRLFVPILDLYGQILSINLVSMITKQRLVSVDVAELGGSPEYLRQINALLSIASFCGVYILYLLLSI